MLSQPSAIFSRLKEVNEILESANFVNNDRLTEQQTTNERMAVQIAQLEARLQQAIRDLEHTANEKNGISSQFYALSKS